MQQFYAHRFVGILHLLDKLSDLSVDGRGSKVVVLSKTLGASLKSCDLLIEQLVDLKLNSSLSAAQRLRSYLAEHRRADSNLSSQIQEMRRRIQDEMEQTFVFGLTAAESAYWNPAEPPFGASVEAAFPLLSEDISEAGKCFAVGRYTACVFHLMRAMEGMLQTFGAQLGVKLAAEKNWQNILDEADKKIRTLAQARDKRAAALAGVAAHLYSVKVAWRNEVMHPKATYTEEEAKSIYGHVRSFAGELVKVMKP